MLRIRLLRIGKKNQPFFRIVLIEHWRAPKGKSMEILGYYNPRAKEIKLKKQRLKYWLSKGAQPSDTVHNLLVSQGIIIDKKKKKHKIGKKALNKEPVKGEVSSKGRKGRKKPEEK